MVKLAFLAFCLFRFLTETFCDFECIPSNCTIEAIETEGYTFGFKNSSTKITNCSYKSDTGISGSFEVVHLKPNKTRKVRSNNLISNNGFMGLCQVKVDKVDDQGPTFWTLLPSNEEDEVTYREVNFTVNFFYKPKLLSDLVSVRENGSFYQYIISNMQMVSCKVKFGDTEIDLDVNVKEDRNSHGRILSMGEGLCGFIFQNASLSDPFDWLLIATDNEKKKYKGKFKVNVYEYPTDAETHIKKYVTIGTGTNFKCGTEFEQKFCQLFNPRGDFVLGSKDCAYTIKTVALHDLGTWKCHIGKSLLMETLTYNVELLSTENTIITNWTTENEKFVTIGCQMLNYGKITSCRMISPTHQVLSLKTGAAFDKYTSFGTNLNNATCGLTIEKPLRNSDKGRWRCEICCINFHKTGAFIFVEDTTIPSYPTYQTITRQLGQSVEIMCSVPYSSQYCYIKSPNGTELIMDNNFETQLGFCSYIIPVIYPEHVGNWDCYFSRETGIPDEKITIELAIGEVLIYTTKIEESSGGNASLMCSSHGLPMQYCRFVSPNSLSYYIGNHENSSRISYLGKGLEYGECGITITNVQTSDTGIWKCITVIGDNFKTPITVSIDLYIAPTFFENPATAIGFGTAGAVLIISGIAFFSVKKWSKQRRTLLQSQLDNEVSQEDSRTDIFNHGYTSYTNLQQSLDNTHAHQP